MAKYDSYFSYFSKYSAEMFQLLAASEFTDANHVKYIRKYKGKEHIINANLINELVVKYFKTYDRSYLIEASILIMALDMHHNNKCFTGAKLKD